MKKIIFNIILVLIILSIPFWIFMYFNVGVSLKYETDGLGECISNVTGNDLCLAQNITQILIITFSLILIILL